MRTHLSGQKIKPLLDKLLFMSFYETKTGKPKQWNYHLWKLTTGIRQHKNVKIQSNGDHGTTQKTIWCEKRSELTSWTTLGVTIILTSFLIQPSATLHLDLRTLRTTALLHCLVWSLKIWKTSFNFMIGSRYRTIIGDNYLDFTFKRSTEVVNTFINTEVNTEVSKTAINIAYWCVKNEISHYW